MYEYHGWFSGNMNCLIVLQVTCPDTTRRKVRLRLIGIFQFHIFVNNYFNNPINIRYLWYQVYARTWWRHIITFPLTLLRNDQIFRWVRITLWFITRPICETFRFVRQKSPQRFKSFSCSSPYDIFYNNKLTNINK